MFVLRKLVKRTRFGPFEAKRVQHMDNQDIFPLRVSDCPALCCGRLVIMKKTHTKSLELGLGLLFFSLNYSGFVVLPNVWTYKYVFFLILFCQDF